MELTDKCKVDFDKWLLQQPNHILHIVETFYLIPKSMQYGVLVDYFDSVGIEISIDNSTKPVFGAICLWINDGFIEEYKTRQEARIEAIKKANEIYNKK